MNNHTYTHRIGNILDKLKVDSNIGLSEPKISLITCTNPYKMISNILQNFDCQLWENKELNLIMDCDKKRFKQIAQELKIEKIYIWNWLNLGLSLGECFNLGIELSKGKYIGKFDDDDLYSTLSCQIRCFLSVTRMLTLSGKLCSFMYHEKS